MTNVLPTPVATERLVRIWSTAIHVLASLASLVSVVKPTSTNVLPAPVATEPPVLT